MRTLNPTTFLPSVLTFFLFAFARLTSILSSEFSVISPRASPRSLVGADGASTDDKDYQH
jgi:hypothetical protein